MFIGLFASQENCTPVVNLCDDKNEKEGEKKEETDNRVYNY